MQQNASVGSMEAAGGVLSRSPRRLLTHDGVVMGVGGGIFLLGLFLLLSILGCLAGSRSRCPGAMIALSTGSYLLIFILMVASPKGEAPEPAPQGHDETALDQLGLGILFALGILGSAVGLTAYVLAPDVYARPLSYHSDVLCQKG